MVMVTRVNNRSGLDETIWDSNVPAEDCPLGTEGSKFNVARYRGVGARRVETPQGEVMARSGDYILEREGQSLILSPEMFDALFGVEIGYYITTGNSLVEDNTSSEVIPPLTVVDLSVEDPKVVKDPKVPVASKPVNPAPKTGPIGA